MNRYLPVAMAVLAGLVFIPSGGNDLAMDDVGDILENPVVQDSRGVTDVVSRPYRGRVPPERSPWRPLTSLIHWTMVQHGNTAFDLHMTNIVGHAVNTALAATLLLALGFGTAAAGAGAAVFAVHPVHVEAVANVVGGAEVLMTLFCLLAALAFLRLTGNTLLRITAVTACFAGALLAKENGVALPGLLLALLLFAPGRGWRRGDGLTFGAMGVVLVGYLAARTAVLGTLIHHDTAPYIVVLDPLTRFTTAVANLTHWARLLVFPRDLIADYGPAVVTPAGIGSLRFWLGVAIAGLTLTGIVRLRHRYPRASLALAWIALSGLVVSNLVFPIGVWVAERTLYLPSLGVAVGVAVLWREIELEARPVVARAAGVAFVLVVLLGAGWSYRRSTVWADTETVLRTLTEEHPESYRSQWYLARTLTDRGDFEGGLRWYERAAETNPNDLRLQFDRVRALLLDEQAARAEVIVRELPGADPVRWVYLAQSLRMQNRPDSARAVVRRGLEVFPDDARLLRQARELRAGDGGER